MSKALASLLDQPEEQLTGAIARLEELSGFSSEDVRLVAEARQVLRRKTQELGMDPDDTSNAELYHSLLARLHRDLEHLNRPLGGKTSGETLTNHLLTVFTHAPIQRRVWAVKHSAARDILRAAPPKRLMKQLRYRSLESMLKRENPALLFAGALSLESASWQKIFCHQLEKLSPADFEDRDVQLIGATQKRWLALAPKQAFITLVPQLGAAVVWPAGSTLAKAGLGLSIFSLQATEMLRDISSFLKLHQLEPEFGKQAVAAWRSGRLAEVAIGSLHFSWQAFRRHFGHQPEGSGISSLAPQLQNSDIIHTQLAEAVGQMWPSLNWWVGNGYLASAGHFKPVSLNLFDALQCYISGAAHGHHSTAAFKKQLWDELACRYMDHPAVEAYALEKLNAGAESEFNANVNIKSKPSLRDLTELLQAV